MAAGEGRRLRPLTERYAKPVLPIDGRPVIVTLLHELRAAGIERVTVVTGHLARAGRGAARAAVRRALRPPARAARLGGRGAARPRRAAARSCSARTRSSRPATSAASRASGGARDRRPARAAALAAAPLRAPARGRRVVKVLDDDPANVLAAAPLWRLGDGFDPARSTAWAARRTSSRRRFSSLIDAGRDRLRRRDRPDP